MSDHDDFEAAYWGDCTNTFDEEQKHYVYARGMGISRAGYAFDVKGKRIIDIGGGPVSMLLKCRDVRDSFVIDPLATKYPKWVHARYTSKNITCLVGQGETAPRRLADRLDKLDEVWIYNCLQHTEDPAKIIQNAKAIAPVLRLFEWIDIPPHEGHPHMLTQGLLEQWIAQPGQVGTFAESGCFGRAFYGCWTHRVVRH